MTLTKLVTEIKTIFETNKSNKLDEINNKLQEYSGDDWKTNLKYDPSRYTRNSVFKDDNCQIMIMCWPPNYVSPIHDHNNSECYNKLLDGSIIEKKFKIKNNDFTLLEESKIEKNDIIRINDEIGLHQRFNFDSKNYAVTLHLYVPAYDSTFIYKRESGHIKKIKVNLSTE